MDKKYEIIEKNDKLITWIIVILAAILTAVSLSMIAVSSLERTANTIESIIMTFLAGSIALSAHLLPALTKRRVGKMGSLVVTFLWIFSVLVTLYSHTVFFVSAGVHAGEIRSQQSGKVDDLKENMAITQQEINNPNVRSVVLIAQDISIIEGRIAALKPRDCNNCKTTKSRIVELEAKKKALDIEMSEAQRIAALRDKTLNMNDHILSEKDNARLDPVTEKLSVIFKGMNVDAITLFLAVLSSALLETLAALFWWLVWPNQKIKIMDKEMFSIKNNLSSSSRKNKDRSKRQEEPLFAKEMVSTFKMEDEKSADEISDNNTPLSEKEENKKIEDSIDSLEENINSNIRTDIKLKKKKIKGYKVVNKKIPREFLNRKIIVPQLKIKENIVSPIVSDNAKVAINEENEIIKPPTILDNKNNSREDLNVEKIQANEIYEKTKKNEISENNDTLLKEEKFSSVEPLAENLLDLSKTIFQITEDVGIKTENDLTGQDETDGDINLNFSPSMFEDKMEVDMLNANKTFSGEKNKTEEALIEKTKVNQDSLLKINKGIPILVKKAINEIENMTKEESKNTGSEIVDSWFDINNLGENIL